MSVPSLDEEAFGYGHCKEWGNLLGKNPETMCILFQNVNGILQTIDGELRLCMWLGFAGIAILEVVF